MERRRRREWDERVMRIYSEILFETSGNNIPVGISPGRMRLLFVSSLISMNFILYSSSAFPKY
jgi:hypothetical protein